MPKSTVEDEADFKLPADTPLPAILNSVVEKTIEFIKDGVKDSFDKWVWEFKITEGDFAGLRAWGETEPKVTNKATNKARQWMETLIGADLDLGQDVDTDDFLGLGCFITVANVVEENKKTGEEYYRCPIADVFPADMEVEPPF